MGDTSFPTITITAPASNSIKLPQYGDSICMAPRLPSSSSSPFSSFSSMAIIGCSSVTGNQWDGQVCIIDLATGRVHASLTTYGGNCAVQSLQLGEDAYFFAGGDDGVVYCWNYRSVLEASENPGDEEGSRKRVKTDESKQSKNPSSPSSSSSPVTDTRPLFNLYDHQNIVSAVSCRSHEVSGRNVGPRTHVLSSSWDATVKLWDIEAPGWPLRTFSTGREAYDVNWDPFSAHNFVSGSRSKLVQIWDTRSKGDCISRLMCDSAAKVTRYNPLKEFELAVGTQAGIVLLFDSRELSKPISKGPPCGAINDIQFSPSCPSILAVASDDARVRVLGSGGPGLSLLMEKLIHVDAVKGVTFVQSTPKVDGHHMVASVSWDSTLQLTSL